MNRHSGEVVIVADKEQDPETHSITSDHAAWSARPYPGHNKDIFVRNLSEGVTFRIESTDYGSQYFPHAEGDYVVWQDHRDGRREIYMHTISTGQEECLTPDTWEQGAPSLRNGIVEWADYRFSEDSGEYGACDIYIYEIETGVGRRVTRQSIERLRPKYVDSGWILYKYRTYAGGYKLFAHDLVGDGILTPDGHVIP